MIHHPHELATRLTEASERLFGTSELSTQLALEADRYRRDVHSIESRRGLQGATVAFVGPTGSGKTALLRLLVDEAVWDRLPAGVRRAERTEQVVWVGPQRPDDLAADHERHVPCVDLADVGRPLVLIDTPGFSSRSGRLDRIAEDALADADLHLLVVRREGIERADVIAYPRRAFGAVVLPVVRARDLEEPSLAAELDTLHTALRASAEDTGGRVLRPVVVADVDVAGEAAWSDVRERLRGALTEALAAMPEPVAMVTSRIEARTRRLRRRVREVLATVRERVEEALRELEQAAERLPAEVVRATLGEDRVLEAGLRARLRVELAEATWGIWFPYRSVLTTVQLTYGAWDRLVLAMTGSLPSWFGTLFAAGRQLRDAVSFEAAVSSLRDRVTTASTDRLGPCLDRFDRAVTAVAGGERPPGRRGSVRLAGLSELQEASGPLVQQVVRAHAVPGWVANLWGLLCTALFWGLFSGPVVALYRHYLSAGSAALTGPARLESFPTPSASFWLTSLALSLLPVLLATVIFVSGAVGARRLRRAGEQVRERHETRIGELREEGVLRLVITDERLDDARFLLSL